MIQIYPNPLQATAVAYNNGSVVPISYRNSPLSTYSYLSSTAYEVSIHDSDTNTYSAAFVQRCGTVSSWAPFQGALSVYGAGVTGVPAYTYSLWNYREEVRFNYLNFGTDGTTKVKVGYKPESTITSVDIGPYSKNYRWSTVNSSSIEISGINPYDKLIITINNDTSSPLYLFANPIEYPPNPADVAYYFSAGIFEVSAIKQNLGVTAAAADPNSNFRFEFINSGDKVYVAPGAYIDGTFSVRNKSDVIISGTGVMDVEREQDIWWTKWGFDNPSVNDATKLKRSAIFGFSSFNDACYAHPLCPASAFDYFGTSNIRVHGLTMVNGIAYANTAYLKEVDNVKIISMWPNCDGPHVEDQSSPNPNKYASLTRSFIQTGDDTVYVGGNQGGGKYLLSGCYLVNLAGTLFRSYFGTSVRPDYYWFSALDLDCRAYSIPGYHNNSIALHQTFTNGIFGIMQSEQKRYVGTLFSESYGQNAINNHLFSGIRVENLIDVPLFDIGIKDYPDYGNPPAFGNMSSIIFKDISVSAHPNSRYNWTYQSRIFADEPQYRPHDLSVINVTINGQPITNVNKDDYIYWYNKVTLPDNDPDTPGATYVGSSIADLYFIIGDSIADGYDSKYSQRFGSIYEDLPSEITGCYLWIPYNYNATGNTGWIPKFEPLRPGVNVGSGYFYNTALYAGVHVTGVAALESILGWKLRQNSGDRDVYIVKCAQGGSLGIKGTSATFTPQNGFVPQDWSISSTSEMFSVFSSMILSATTNLRQQYKNVDFKGGVIILGTNTPIETANFLTSSYDPYVTGVNIYKDVTAVESRIDTDISSLVSSIRGILIANNIDTYYSDLIWVIPNLRRYSWGPATDSTELNDYFLKLENKITSLSSVNYSAPSLSSSIVSLNLAHYYSFTGAEYAAYPGDTVHYNFSGYAKMADEIYGILQQQTSSVTDPDLNPDVNITFRVSETATTPYIKVNDTWKQADPYVKINGDWKFADPGVKISGDWKQ
jgi:hypothetical protein